jgi:hypothetical protein
VDRKPIIAIRHQTEYLYTSRHPPGCEGCRYRVIDLIENPTAGINQKLVLMLALEGPDAGKQFAITPFNFAMRYKNVENQEPEPAVMLVEEKLIGPNSEGWTGV